MAITTDDGTTGQSKALFRAYNMNYSLADIINVKKWNTKFLAVCLKGLNLNTAFLIFDWTIAIPGRDIMIGDGQCRSRSADFPASVT